MASLLKLDRLSRFFMKFYRGQRYRTSPNTPLRLPLNECKVALITTAGFFFRWTESFWERRLFVPRDSEFHSDTSTHKWT